MIRFRVKKSGFRDLIDRLRDIRNYMRRPMRYSYDRLNRELSGEIIENFRRRYDPMRRRGWPAKADGTPATLIRTGRMFRALTKRQAWQRRGDKGIFFNPGRAVHYWRFHQEGTRNMPARGVLPARERITQIVEKEMGRQVEVRWQ